MPVFSAIFLTAPLCPHNSYQVYCSPQSKLLRPDTVCQGDPACQVNIPTSGGQFDFSHFSVWDWSSSSESSSSDDEWEVEHKTGNVANQIAHNTTKQKTIEILFFQPPGIREEASGCEQVG